MGAKHQSATPSQQKKDQKSNKPESKHIKKTHRED